MARLSLMHGLHRPQQFMVECLPSVGFHAGDIDHSLPYDMNVAAEVWHGLADCLSKLRFREVVDRDIMPSNKSREQVSRGNPHQAVCFGGRVWLFEVELWYHRFIVVRVGLPHLGCSAKNE